jgi:UDP-N-acetylglucosamine 2-epimerase (non-hydrolysing)
MTPLRVLVVFGTRPEAIKMVPVIKALKAKPKLYCVKVCVTAQHRELLDQVLEEFSVKPDIDLDLMSARQDLYDVTARVLRGMKTVIGQTESDLVLVHGDTTTTAAASLSAFYAGIPIGHVEAGLRTFNKRSPFPEEVNRRITGIVADLHFVPTQRARQNLLDEHVSDNCIFVTGNTSIDALKMAQERMGLKGRKPGRRILVTAHRRENFGEGIANICDALKIIGARYPGLEIIYPLHPNPNVCDAVRARLQGIPNIKLIPALGYFEFVREMFHATLILSDSGGVQEEAPTFGKPVLVLRDTTERPEAVEAGTAKLIGTGCERIVQCVSELLENEDLYSSMARARNPFGDGTAAIQIEAAIQGWFSRQKKGFALGVQLRESE